MKWFSIRGIASEIKRIRWPKSSETIKGGIVVLIFSAIFAFIFIGFDFIFHLLKGLI